MNDVVVFCLIDPFGRYLLETKPATHSNEPGLLVFPGGHIEEGESPESALRRELIEEYAISDGRLEIEWLGIVDDYYSPTGKQFRLHVAVVLGWSGCFRVLDAGPSKVWDHDAAIESLTPERARILEIARRRWTRHNHDRSTS